MPSGRLVQILLLASAGALTASAFELVSKKGAMSRLGAHVIGAVAALVFAFFRSGRAPGITLLEHLFTAPGLMFIALAKVARDNGLRHSPDLVSWPVPLQDAPYPV
jgi:hypothetical protein